MYNITVLIASENYVYLHMKNCIGTHIYKPLFMNIEFMELMVDIVFMIMEVMISVAFVYGSCSFNLLI